MGDIVNIGLERQKRQKPASAASPYKVLHRSPELLILMALIEAMKADKAGARIVKTARTLVGICAYDRPEEDAAADALTLMQAILRK